jgi:hypothetical protein
MLAGNGLKLRPTAALPRDLRARSLEEIRLVGPPGRIAGRFGVNHDDLAHRGPSATARRALGHSDRLRPLRLAFSSVTWRSGRLAHDEARPAACQESCVWWP